MWVECMRLNDEPLVEMDCLKYQGSQVVGDGGCEMDVRSIKCGEH